jgi:hypothetical protein
LHCACEICATWSDISVHRSIKKQLIMRCRGPHRSWPRTLLACGSYGRWWVWCWRSASRLHTCAYVLVDNDVLDLVEPVTVDMYPMQCLSEQVIRHGSSVRIHVGVVLVAWDHRHYQLHGYHIFDIGLIVLLVACQALRVHDTIAGSAQEVHDLDTFSFHSWGDMTILTGRLLISLALPSASAFRSSICLCPSRAAP